MTDEELIDAQHRALVNMPCGCRMEWKKDRLDVKEQCARCRLIVVYYDRKAKQV